MAKTEYPGLNLWWPRFHQRVTQTYLQKHERLLKIIHFCRRPKQQKIQTCILIAAIRTILPSNCRHDSTCCHNTKVHELWLIILEFMKNGKSKRYWNVTQMNLGTIDCCCDSHIAYIAVCKKVPMGRPNSPYKWIWPCSLLLAKYDVALGINDNISPKASKVIDVQSN